MEDYAFFLTGIKSITDNKKDFSLSFETFDVILLKVANNGNWKSNLNLLYNDHDVT